MNYGTDRTSSARRSLHFAPAAVTRPLNPRSSHPSGESLINLSGGKIAVSMACPFVYSVNVVLGDYCLALL